MIDAVLLFSGGLDSTALAWSLRPVLLLTVDYGQRGAEGEIRSTTAIARDLGLDHEVACIRPPFGAGQMLSDGDPIDGVPEEWWPFRNQLLITLGAALAASRGFDLVLIGTVADDAHYADGRDSFIAAMGTLMKLQERPVRLEAPALYQRSADLVRGVAMPARLAALTHSCSRARVACGNCGSCIKSREVLEEVFTRG